MPGYRCEVHHVREWATTHCTDIDQLTLACGAHHKLLDSGWTTRNNIRGDTEWIPPAHLDSPGSTGRPRTNTYFHPEKLLRDGNDEDEPG